MENISLTTWEQHFVVDEKLSIDKYFDTKTSSLILYSQDYVDMINCHEMAHSYFGDALVIRHYDQAWYGHSL